MPHRASEVCNQCLFAFTQMLCLHKSPAFFVHPKRKLRVNRFAMDISEQLVQFRVELTVDGGWHDGFLLCSCFHEDSMKATFGASATA